MERTKGKVKKLLLNLFESLIIRIFLLLAISTSTVYILRNGIRSFLFHSIPIWVSLLMLIFIIGIIYLFVHKRKRHHLPIIHRSKRIEEIEIPFEAYKVNWIAYAPNRVSLCFIDEYVRIKGPYCPTCHLSLTWKKGIFGIQYYWLCEGCNKKYPRPRKEKYEMIKFMEDLAYAEIFGRKKFEKKMEVNTPK